MASKKSNEFYNGQDAFVNAALSGRDVYEVENPHPKGTRQHKDWAKGFNYAAENGNF